MRSLLTITAFDLRQRLRDRSVVIFGLVVPLALMGVFNLLFSGLDENPELEPVTVAASVPEDDRMADVVVGALTELDVIDVSVEEASAAQVRRAADEGTADLGLVLPDGFGGAVTSGRPATVRMIEGDGAGLETDVLISVVQGTVDQLAAGAVASAAGQLAGLPADQVAGLAGEAATAGRQIAVTEGRALASDEQLTTKGMLVAGQAGLFLLFTVGFGVHALLAEREHGTMARLLSMPMRPSTVIAAKALSGFLLGVLATSLLLAAGSVLFGVDFGPVGQVAVLVLAVVAAATSLTFIVARLARTAEQANMMQTVIAVLLGMAGGAFFPIPAMGWVGMLLDLNPVAAFIRGLGVTAGRAGASELVIPLLILLGFTVVCLAVSRLVPDRTARV